jgi:hypothetical protein
MDIKNRQLNIQKILLRGKNPISSNCMFTFSLSSRSSVPRAMARISIWDQNQAGSSIAAAS